MRGGGGEAPSRGEWGVSPQIFSKRGQAATISNRPASGTQNPGKPSAHEGGRKGVRGHGPLARGLGDVPPEIMGVEGAKPLPGGSGGCPPRFFQRGGKPPPLAIGQRVGPKTLANPQPTRVGEKKGAGG